jgi:hypothetical protein
MNSPNGGDRVEELLRVLAREDERLNAPAVVEQAVMSAVRARRARPLRMALALAASLTLGIAISLLAPGPDVHTARAPERPRPEIGTGYFPLRAGPLLNEGELGQVVRMSVPRRELYRYGFDSLGNGWNGGTATVRADVLVGMDGTARAIRFVH